MSRETHTGGCQCGAVRYRIQGETFLPHTCHCRMCQKASGNYFMALASVDKADFIVTRGTISWFRSSGPSRRGFCANCGTPLVYEQLSRANTNVALGSLDDPLSIRPAYQFGAESRIPFLCEILSIPATVSMDDPEEDGVKLAEVASTNRQHPDHDTPVWPMEGKP